MHTTGTASSSSSSSFASWYNWYRGKGKGGEKEAGSLPGGGIQDGAGGDGLEAGRGGPGKGRGGEGKQEGEIIQQQQQQQQQKGPGGHARDPALLVDAVPVTRAHIKAGAAKHCDLCRDHMSLTKQSMHVTLLCWWTLCL